MAEDVFYPIVYVRGYAMSRGEMDETTADPFCGFNLGSTVYRANLEKDKPPRKFVFESPVIRLGSDFGYKDVFDDGIDIVDPGWEKPIPSKSIVVYRYYEQASSLLGNSQTPEIEDFAKGLNDLILRVRDLVCQEKKNKLTKATFRCYLVAHSMGGLVCRAFLQNPKLGTDEARRCVDKIFTYATPHNGIEVLGLNVPSWLGLNKLDTFNRDRMAEYLNLKAEYQKTKRVDWIPESVFPSARFFNMVGTNRMDYDVAAGASRTFVGQGSDGLVKVDNAAAWGINDQGVFSSPCATAYTYRSHSGYFGIVNSEEGYQNLTRFLFGDVRVDAWLDIENIRLPADLAKEEQKGKTVNALYQIEFMASPRGKRWYLSRRTSEEDSVSCRKHQDLRKATAEKPNEIYLSTIFLANRAKVNPNGKTLAYSVTIGIRAPEYQLELKFWPDKHYEGGYLFQDSVVVELKPPTTAKGSWQVTHDWQSDNLGEASKPLPTDELENGKVILRIPFTSDPDGVKSPGVSGTLRLEVSKWNS